MKTNIKVVVSNGFSGEVKLDALMTARSAEVFTNNLLDTLNFAIVTVRQNDSGEVLSQTGKGKQVSVPVCNADYPAYTVDITL